MLDKLISFFDYNRLDSSLNIPFYISMLILSSALFIWFMVFRYRQSFKNNHKLRNRFRWGLIITIIGTELISKIMHIIHHDITSFRDLPYPFHICGVLVILNSIYLIKENKTLHKIVLFPSLGATIIPLIITDVRFPATEFMFYEFYIAHFASGLAAIFFMFTYDSYPTAKSTIISGIGVITWGLLMIPVNMLLKSYYSYVGPYAAESFTQLQMFGTWPTMIIPMLLTVALIFAVLTCIVHLLSVKKHYFLRSNFKK